MAINDNIQDKIKKARAAGYTDAQISTFLKSSGVNPSVVSTVPAAAPSLGADIKTDFNKRVDTGSDAIISDQNKLSKGVQVLGQGAGFVSDIASEVVKHATPQPIKDAVSHVAEDIVSHPAVQDVQKKYEAFKLLHPEAAKNIEATGLLASLIPVGKVADTAAEVAAQATARTAEGAAKTIATTGRATKGVGESVYKSGITPTVAEAERIQGYNAKVPFLTRVRDTLTGNTSAQTPVTRGDTALEKGIAGREKDIGVQATREADRLYTQKIAPAVKASKEVVTKDDLFAPIAKRIADTVEPGRKQALQEAFDAIQDEYKNHSTWSLEEGQKLKSELDQFTPEKVFRGKSVVNEYRTLQNDMANAIRQKTYGALKDVNIRKDYLDYGNLAELRKLGVKALTNASGKGGFGSFWTGAYDAATVPVKTIGGQVLYRVGNKLEFVGQKGLKTFGQFLKARGYNRP